MLVSSSSLPTYGSRTLVSGISGWLCSRNTYVGVCNTYAGHTYILHFSYAIVLRRSRIAHHGLKSGELLQPPSTALRDWAAIDRERAQEEQIIQQFGPIAMLTHPDRWRKRKEKLQEPPARLEKTERGSWVNINMRTPVAVETT
ncbi:hypothetical protein CMEL01_01380 [Colletotrichum melonis]|uniref:Uncharacterized protein n=1 Tax=Colletotrichum melonis TaxID=1209925 RepID=A0AAI9V346_9PEZI|nr:hypothetical protein CMEL01_01380 [Colletotrichum melonis]